MRHTSEIYTKRQNAINLHKEIILFPFCLREWETVTHHTRNTTSDWVYYYILLYKILQTVYSWVDKLCYTYAVNKQKNV